MFWLTCITLLVYVPYSTTNLESFGQHMEPLSRVVYEKEIHEITNHSIYYRT